MRAISGFFFSTILLTTFSTALNSYAAEPGGKEAVAEGSQVTKPDSKPSRPRITVSKETTYITAPLLPDGYPDYISALNEISGKGVTPENNAAVAFWRAVGPKYIDIEFRERFFKKLGIQILPEEGEYLLTLYKYSDQKSLNIENPDLRDKFETSLLDQRDRCLEEPWSKSEYPELAAYIDANEKPLSIILQGSQRPHYFSPLVSKGDGGIMDSNWTHTGISEKRDISFQLPSRAMLKLHDGKVEEAWQDLLAAHRLARLDQQSPLAVDILLAAVLEVNICKADAAFVRHSNLTASQANAFLANLRKLPPFISVADKWDIGERMFALDLICTLAKSAGKKGYPGLELSERASDMFYDIFPEEKSKIETLKKLTANPRVDWDEVARMTNARLDRVVAAHRLPGHQQRCDALDKMDTEAEEMMQKTIKAINDKTSKEEESPKVLAKHMDAILAGPDFIDTKGVMVAMDRLHMQVSLVELSFALAAYRADYKKYPAALAELKPKYLSEIPKDLFSDKELVYKPQENGQGYLLYSLGPNSRDDGGENYDDNPDKYKDLPNDKRLDDIASHMP
jgi:hypothetical protein